MGRKIEGRYFVYRNLNLGNLSIQDRKTRRVIDHAAQVAISEPTFLVRPGGRERVLRSRRKNVHAGVIGNRRKIPRGYKEWPIATYNPYKYSTFVLKDCGTPITKAKIAVIDQAGSIYVLDPIIS